MGVRGLTTYVERNKHLYLKPHNLQDCNLIIDGNSLCAQLYKFNTKSNDVFGGDYDKFAKSIELFFSMLQQCNVTPIVIFDGGYEQKKLKTVNLRLQNKLELIHNINPVYSDNVTIFPLFLRECFKDTLIKLKISLMRCNYEADTDIANIARQMKCPVLSYDSDFYIYDCSYIPFNTLDLNVTRIRESKKSKYCIKCSIYNIDSFLQHHNIKKNILPLMATLLGNDYVKKSAFSKFYDHLKLPKKNKTHSHQFRTIIALINWLQNETYDSAIKKILSRVKKNQRDKFFTLLKNVTEGYISTDSEVLTYFGLTVQNDNTYIIPDIKMNNIDSDDNDETNESFLTDLLDIDLLETELDVNDRISKTNEEKLLDMPWFKDNIRSGNFPTLFIDILTLNLGIYTPQVENITSNETISIIMPILHGICKILLKNSERTFFYYLAKNEHATVKKHKFQLPDIKVPELDEIIKLNINERYDYLCSLLEINETILKKILEFPNEWQLYLLAFIYWGKNAKQPKITYNHVCCIILCLIHLNIIDKNVPGIRSKKHFEKKFGVELEGKNNLTENLPELKDFKNAISTTNMNDNLVFINAFVSHFEMDEKLKSNKNLFSIDTVDAFAQFQNCLLHIKYLNALLNFPLNNFNVCEFFNGTYIYNLYKNFEKRINIDNYIELMLKNSPLILSVFKEIINNLNSILNLSVEVKTNRKVRKRKKNKIDTNSTNISEKISSESESNEIFDVNNKFSILFLKENL